MSAGPPDRVQQEFQAAVAAYRRGDLAAAAEGYRRLLAREPRHTDSLLALGVALKDLGKSDEAIDCWQRALKINPRLAAAHNNLGALYRLMHRPKLAIAQLRAALKLEPRDSMAAGTLSQALLEIGQTTEAERLARGVLEREPGNAQGRMTLGFALAYQGKVEEAADAFLEAQRLAPQAAAAISNALFASLYSDKRDAAGVLALHRELSARIAPAAPVRTQWRNDRDPERRLRIGYLSPDLRSHPVSVFFEPILQHHDARRVAIHCYSTGTPDAVTARLRGMAQAWHDCAGWSDARICAQIEADGIDILVDLAGHTALNRAPVLRARPAPLQAGYLGYPGTTGMPELDYVITDAFLCPPELERHYCERVVRMERSYWCYRAPASVPPVAALPARRNGHVTFGSYNALQKISPATIALWVRVLVAVPDSRLVLKTLAFGDEELCAEVGQRFARAGLAPARLDLLPPIQGADYLAAYDKLDIALDPTPYNGGTTSCEALWMGVPVITLAGERYTSRMGTTLLENLGLPELVARSADDYVRIAAQLAGDLPRLEALRSGLRERMAASPVCDAPGRAHALEKVYREMWRAWAE